jgi:hypothetical protein
MNALLWVLQVLLAAVFAAHGWLLLSPPADLIPVMNETMSTEFRLFLGAAEVLAAVGFTPPASRASCRGSCRLPPRAS